jgi:hypothetical protein
MRVPKFDRTSDDHRRLTAISLEAHKRRGNSLDSSYLSDELEDELTSLVRRIARP